MEKYGFVYIWYDRKRKMYYIGSHWGTEDDGYICSSNRMRDAYRRRPTDFKRRILARVDTTRSDLLDEEQRWFDKVKNRDRYYNLNWIVQNNYWWNDPDVSLTVGEKISKSKRGKKYPKISEARKGNPTSLGKFHSDETKKKISNSKKGISYDKSAYESRRSSFEIVDPDGCIYQTNDLKKFSDDYGICYKTMIAIATGKHRAKNPYKGGWFAKKI